MKERYIGLRASIEVVRQLKKLKKELGLKNRTKVILLAIDKLFRETFSIG